jgi:ribosomal protein S18 acetylase RimI-like enzyme
MDIRPYRYQDRASCLAIFDSNFNSAQQREEFEAFLRSTESTCFVAEHNDEVIACGGFSASSHEARLQWGMVRRDLQRQGVGRFLLLYRLKAIGNLPGIQFVQAVVPAPLTRFYEKNGLKLQREGDGLAEMRMKMQVCSA